MAAPIYSFGKKMVHVEEAGIKKGVFSFWRELKALKNGGKDTFIKLGDDVTAESLTFTKRLQLTFQHFYKKYFGPLFGKYKPVSEKAENTITGKVDDTVRSAADETAPQAVTVAEKTDDTVRAATGQAEGATSKSVSTRSRVPKKIVAEFERKPRHETVDELGILWEKKTINNISTAEQTRLDHVSRYIKEKAEETGDASFRYLDVLNNLLAATKGKVTTASQMQAQRLQKGGTRILLDHAAQTGKLTAEEVSLYKFARVSVDDHLKKWGIVGSHGMLNDAERAIIQKVERNIFPECERALLELAESQPFSRMALEKAANQLL